MFYNATEQKLIIIINDRTVKYNSLFKRSKYGEIRIIAIPKYSHISKNIKIAI